MARPAKNHLDYFPFYCREGQTSYIIEKKYKNDGFAVWVKVLRQLTVTDFHYKKLDTPAEVMYMASCCNVSEEVLLAILNDLVELGEFDKELWVENRILWNPKFIESIQDAYKKRTTSKPPSKQGLLQLLSSLGIRKLKLSDRLDNQNPQIKLEEKKENKTKEEEIKMKETKIYDEENIEIIIKEMLSDDLKIQELSNLFNLEKTKTFEYLQRFITDQKAGCNLNRPLEHIWNHFKNSIKKKLNEKNRKPKSRTQVSLDVLSKVTGQPRVIIDKNDDDDLIF